jgi:hypothetical protein
MKPTKETASPTLSTLGACHATLVRNGYAAVSALRGAGFHSFRYADEPAAILTAPQSASDCGLDDARARHAIALIVTAQDADTRANLISIVEAVVGETPRRVGSDGSIAYLVRYERTQYENLATRESCGFVVESTICKIPGAPLDSSLLRVDGEWLNGSPLTVPRNQLIELTEISLNAIWSEASGLTRAPADDYKYDLHAYKKLRGKRDPHVHVRSEFLPWSADGAVNGVSRTESWAPHVVKSGIVVNPVPETE